MFNLLSLASAANLIGTLLLGSPVADTNPGATTKAMSFDASAYVTQQSKIRVALEKTQPGIVSVRLLDPNKNVLYSTATGKKQMKAAWQFNLSELGNGTYTLEISGNEGQLVRQIAIGQPKANRTIAML